jgi:acylphosphatase
VYGEPLKVPDDLCDLHAESHREFFGEWNCSKSLSPMKQPLGVEKEIIVSQRTLEAWHAHEHEKPNQLPPETTAQEEPLSKYREFVRWAWTGEQLSQRDVQRLSASASQLGLSADTLADIEREVMGDTKEAILERREQGARLHAESGKLKRAHVYVSGQLQGVFFRDWARQKTEQLGLSGWVQNLPDGRIEALFEGPEDRVREMIRLCEEGPSHAIVENVDTEFEDLTFEVR